MARLINCWFKFWFPPSCPQILQASSPTQNRKLSFNGCPNTSSAGISNEKMINQTIMASSEAGKISRTFVSQMAEAEDQKKLVERLDT